MSLLVTSRVFHVLSSYSPLRASGVTMLLHVASEGETDGIEVQTRTRMN